VYRYVDAFWGVAKISTRIWRQVTGQWRRSSSAVASKDGDEIKMIGKTEIGKETRRIMNEREEKKTQDAVEKQDERRGQVMIRAMLR
jgi:hypothetical protein